MNEQFWNKVQRGNSKECWPWMGAMSGGRYPSIKWEGKGTTARRVAWMLAIGVIPDRCEVTSDCHSACMNPGHLRLRRPKLSRCDVHAIRTSVLPRKVLVSLYRVGREIIGRIQREGRSAVA